MSKENEKLDFSKFIGKTVDGITMTGAYQWKERFSVSIVICNNPHDIKYISLINE